MSGNKERVSVLKGKQEEPYVEQLDQQEMAPKMEIRKHP
jgi:hypothetical protein